MRVDWQCDCGGIDYRPVVDARRVVVGRCTVCQVLGGTAFRASVPVSATDFVLLTGTPFFPVRSATRDNRRSQVCGPDIATPVCAADAREPKTYALPRRQIGYRSAQPQVLAIDHIARSARE